jgi:hypothetical protein
MTTKNRIEVLDMFGVTEKDREDFFSLPERLKIVPLAMAEQVRLEAESDMVERGGVLSGPDELFRIQGRFIAAKRYKEIFLKWEKRWGRKVEVAGA